MDNTTLFSNPNATNQTYKNIRSEKSQRHSEMKQYCELLWQKYQQYSDNHFLIEIGNNFHSRFWEMYLTVSLIEMGFDVQCPKPGPDVGINIDGRTIWFEATCPTKGELNSPNRVPDIEMGVAQNVPNEKMLLRYLNSISEKYNNQYQSWLRENIVSENDAFVIAINPSLLGFDYGDTIPPRILQTAFPIGSLLVELDQKKSKPVKQSHTTRPTISKANGSKVNTGIFLNNGYQQLSALLCSRVNALDNPKLSGEDFQLLPNPHSINLLPKNFKLRGTYYLIENDKEEYQVTTKKYLSSSAE